MAYPEHLIQRTIELSPGRSAGEILRELRKEFSDNDLPDERTIRRWRQHKQKLYVEEKQTEIIPLVGDNLKEHYMKLAGVSESLLAHNLKRVMKWVSQSGNVEYQLFDEDEIHLIARLTKDDLSGQLEENLLTVYSEYTEWFYKNCFLPHLFSEWLEDVKAKMSNALLYDYPYELIETLRLLAERKTFKGTCPVCQDYINTKK